jgi:2-iminobutanoate/2-iminopropanoate deaminase
VIAVARMRAAARARALPPFRARLCDPYRDGPASAGVPAVLALIKKESSIMTRNTVTTDRLSPPVGPFSLAVHGGGLLFLSGQVAQDPATGKLIDEDAAGQADRILRNLATALEAAGKDLGDVVRVGVYLTDMSDFAAVNEVYRRHFTHPYPARTAIGVAALPLGAAVEMDVVVG